MVEKIRVVPCCWEGLPGSLCWEGRGRGTLPNGMPGCSTDEENACYQSQIREQEKMQHENGKKSGY